MPTTMPAMRGKFGSTEYFLVTMPAKELTERLVIPKEMPEWSDMSVEERFQREINYKRVKEHIAPYLAADPDRFFGAFIVAVLNTEKINFEPLGDVITNLPNLYRDTAKPFGFVLLSGDELLVPLDGQHRLAALKFAITGKDEKSLEIDGIEPSLDVAKDHCTVILIHHNRTTSRKIFNKVNRYAKSTSKADNLITADDDIAAVIAREEIADKIIHGRLVKRDSGNTLGVKDPEFTTLATIYEGTVDVLQAEFGKLTTSILPDTPTEKLYRAHAKSFWETILENIELYDKTLHDPSEVGDAIRCEVRKDFVLTKPIIMRALVKSVLRLHNTGADGSRISLLEICKRINSVDWSVDNPLWQNVLMKGSKVITGNQASAYASRFMAYILGEKLTPVEIAALQKSYISYFDDPVHAPKSLPKALF